MLPAGYPEPAHAQGKKMRRRSKNASCQSRPEQVGSVWRSHELLESRVTLVPTRGPPDPCGYEENCPEPNSPTLWPLETQNSPSEPHSRAPPKEHWLQFLN